MKTELSQQECRNFHFQEEYESLAKGLSDFVVKLLDNVRGYEELFVLLRGADSDGSEVQSTSSAAAMARLKLALQRNEKGVG